MALKFKWRVTADASGGGTFTVAKSQFGDGYRQNVQLGINNDIQKWNVTHAGPRAEVAESLAFIRAHAGAIRFLWTPPLGVEGTYTCEKYTPVDQGGGFYTVAYEFEEAPTP